MDSAEIVPRDIERDGGFQVSQKNISLRELSSWDEAAREARRQLGESKLRSGRLRAAIKYFERQSKAGEPWPVSRELTEDDSFSKC